MKSHYRHLLLSCGVALSAIGVAAIVYAVTAAGDTALWWIGTSVESIGAQLPALAAICGGALLVLGIYLLGVPGGQVRRRRYRYGKHHHGGRQESATPAGRPVEQDAIGTSAAA